MQELLKEMSPVIRSHVDRIVRKFRGQDRDDVESDAWYSAWKGIDKYDPSINGDGSLRKWIERVLHTELPLRCLDRIRKHARRIVASSEDNCDVVAPVEPFHELGTDDDILEKTVLEVVPLHSRGGERSRNEIRKVLRKKHRWSLWRIDRAFRRAEETY